MLGLLEPVVADHVAAKRVISLLGDPSCYGLAC